MQADHLMETLAYQSDQYIYLSPLPRVIQTAQPWITQHKGIDIMSLETYQQAYTLYQQYWNEGRLTDMAILDQSVYEIYPHIYIDFRL